MSDASSATSVVDYPDFLTSAVDLRKLLKELAKESKGAIATLARLMETSQDEKVQARAAEKLLEYYGTIAREVNTDQLQRLIANARVGNGPTRLVNNQNQMPVINFHEIQKIE